MEYSRCYLTRSKAKYQAVHKELISYCCCHNYGNEAHIMQIYIPYITKLCSQNQKIAFSLHYLKDWLKRRKWKSTQTYKTLYRAREEVTERWDNSHDGNRRKGEARVRIDGQTLQSITPLSRTHPISRLTQSSENFDQGIHTTYSIYKTYWWPNFLSDQSFRVLYVTWFSWYEESHCWKKKKKKKLNPGIPNQTIVVAACGPELPHYQGCYFLYR